MGCFDIILQTDGSLHPDGEPSDFISVYTGGIQYTRDKDGRSFRVGKVKAYRIHTELAWASGESAFDVCDSHSQELHEVYAAVFDVGEDDLKDSIRRQFDGINSDVLVVDYVLLNPKWRGLRLGLLVVRKLVDLLGGGCGLVVSDIYPLNPDADEFKKVPASWIPRHADKEAEKEARTTLRRYFKQMGFERIKGTRFYGLSLAKKVPTLAELLRLGKEKPR